MLLPNLSPDAIVTIVLAVLAYMGTIWKVYSKLIEKLNGQGGRIDAVEFVSNENKVKIETLKEQVSEERTALMTQMFNNEKAAAERHADLREQLGRLDERLKMMDIIKTMWRNHGSPQD